METRLNMLHVCLPPATHGFHPGELPVMTHTELTHPQHSLVESKAQGRKEKEKEKARLIRRRVSESQLA